MALLFCFDHHSGATLSWLQGEDRKLWGAVEAEGQTHGSNAAVDVEL